ncbi:EAL domain-containing protein [Desulfurobacterium atlanticum]|uniref:EAL domain, c-di-GMP-specific phosphodiesterase class I (Or its enzymatically inactive variant) n=1 Tax=Desulfurobacterium atlanticum TaxID=240169 RepID=A0A239A3X7_9BACT|nr:EAL domain-containing protein [Desulfurobacterium atlanticum]SNR90189.1 EAL domain, c-di-GMP-specific phosphodiesterase class I (or its enzymatically inactive variant) [Desulfurobacterium atlanticum]
MTEEKLKVWEKLKKPVLVVKPDREIIYSNEAFREIFNTENPSNGTCSQIIFGKLECEDDSINCPLTILQPENRYSCTILKTINEKDYLIECFKEREGVVFIFTDVTEIVKEFGKQKVEDIKRFSDALIKEVENNEKTFLTLISIGNYDELVKIYGIETAIVMFGKLEAKVKELLVNMNLTHGSECLSVTNGSLVILFKNGFSIGEIIEIEEKIMSMLSDFEIEAADENILLTTILVTLQLKKEEFSTTSDLISSMLLTKSKLSLVNEKKASLETIAELEKFIQEKRKKLKLILESLREDKIDVYFQPIVDLRTGKINHFEVLMRVIQDDKVISAGYFIDELYENNLSIECDLKVLQKLLTYREILAQLKCPININISHRSLGSALYRDAFSKTVQFLQNAGIKVNVEITEQVLFDNFKILEIASRDLDFLIYIDDFGSGYSSFRLVAELVKRGMLAGIKIDGSLIKNIENDENLKKVVSLISFMTEVFNIDIIAEYIENDRVVELLKSFKVKEGQGYYFSKPVSIREIENVVRRFS